MSEFEVLILEKSGLFAFENSISVDPSTAHVAPLCLLHDYHSSLYPTIYRRVIDDYYNLENFFRTAGRDIVREGLITKWPQWNYEVMTVKNYFLDKRRDHGYFSNLTWNYMEEDLLLFVFYAKEDKRRYEAERANLNKKTRKKQEMMENNMYDSIPSVMISNENAITNEVLGLCHKLTPTQKSMDSVRHLRKKIQNMLNQVWPGMNYQAAIFGSSANSLALTNADVDFCIVVPEARYEQDLYQYRTKLSRIPKSVYNMFYLASRLRSIGMKGVEAIGHASVPICKFIDPQTGLNCDINTNNILGIENTRLIQRYCDLDSRIRPLIFAIKQFVKQKNINNPRGGTLSSYAYVIMVLHFLMAKLKNPVIPSLQRLSATCTSRDCNYKSFKPIPVLHDQKIVKCDARYHDCVQIQGVGEFGSQINGATTTWHGKNKESIASLLTQFFEYYSTPNNYTLSIISSDGNLVQADNLYPNKYPFIIQDPFIVSKNVARSCTTVGANIIIREFQRAAELLNEGGHSFQKICDPTFNLNRPIDTESMEFRFQQKEQRKIAKQDKFVGYLDREKKQTIDIWTGSESEAEATIHIEEEEVITWANNSPLKIERPSKVKKEKASSSSSAESSESTNTTNNLSPILQLVKTIMSLQPKSENEEPCTDMFKLSNDPIISSIDPKDLYYLISQLNLFGDVVASKVISKALQQQDSSFREPQSQAAYLQQLQQAFETMGLMEEEDDDEDDDDDSYNLNGTDSDIEYDDEEELHVNYVIDNVPDHLDSYEIFNLLQWYGHIRDIDYRYDPPSWCVNMIMKFKNVKLLPINPDFDGYICDGQAYIL